MGIELTATIVGLVIQVFVTIFTIGHFVGKNEDRLAQLETLVEGLRKEYLKINSDFLKHKDEHEKLKTELAISNTQLGADIGFFGRELKELKDTFKEFTKEMREWRVEITSKK